MPIDEKMSELDSIADLSGGYVDFVPFQDLHYDYRKMLEYCKKKNVSPTDLDEEEIKQFLIVP